jgi:hypothetical protein
MYGTFTAILLYYTGILVQKQHKHVAC